MIDILAKNKFLLFAKLCKKLNLRSENVEFMLISNSLMPALKHASIKIHSKKTLRNLRDTYVTPIAGHG
jgi:hypothetical protein